MARAAREILVIDDDESTLAMVEKILSGAGYKALLVGTIADALELVQRRIPHLVITDLRLRNESGFEYLEKHRKIKELANVPVIVLSGVRLSEAIYQATSLGAVDYVTKPIDTTVLLAKVKKALKDRKFPHYVVPLGKQSTVQLQAPGSIVQANEVGFLLEAPVRLAEGSQIEITSPLLRSLGCDSCVFQRTNVPSRPGFPGQYLNDIAVIGLNSIQSMRIREIMKGWK